MNFTEPHSEVLPDTLPLRNAFVGWQCRSRQIAMRENLGKPDNSIMPTVYQEKTNKPFGQIITVLLKKAAYSKTLELKQIFKRTNDPSERRENALQLFSEAYYQIPAEFSDTLTATFTPNSSSTKFFMNTRKCILKFCAYSQQFELTCNVFKLEKSDPSYQATWWHNRIFNPRLNPETIIIGFEPNWIASKAQPI